MTARVRIPIWHGVEDLPVASVIAVADAARALGVTEWDVGLVAEEAYVTTAGGLRVVPHALGWDALRNADVLVVPGHRDPEACTPGPALTRALRAHLDGAGAERVLAAAGNGVLVLARAGLLEGRRVVAPRALRDAVRPAAEDVVTGRRVLRDGRVVTASAAAATVELALHLVESHASADAANRVADALEVKGWVAGAGGT